MAFLDDLGKTLTDMGKDAAQKTKDVVDILQMKAQIGTEKSKLRDLYATIGKSYYEVHKDSAEAEHAEACGQIESSLAKIAELEEKISRLDNTVTCPSCGAVLDGFRILQPLWSRCRIPQPGFDGGGRGRFR